MYTPRPGSYAVIINHDFEVAVLQVQDNYFLPGGGIEPGELPEEALRREALEECGWSLAVGSLIGEAVDYIEVHEDGPYYEIQSRFYRAEFVEKIRNPKDPEHHLVWLPVQQACTQFRRKSQAWVTGLFLP